MIQKSLTVFFYKKKAELKMIIELTFKSFNNPNLAQLVERKAVKFVETFRSLVRF